MSETESAKDSPDKVVKLADTVKVEDKAKDVPVKVVSKADRPKETLTDCQRPVVVSQRLLVVAQFMEHAPDHVQGSRDKSVFLP